MNAATRDPRLSLLAATLVPISMLVALFQIRRMAHLYSGLVPELPLATRFVLAIPSPVILLAALATLFAVLRAPRAIAIAAFVAWMTAVLLTPPALLLPIYVPIETIQ